MRRALLAASVFALALPTQAFARGEFDPTTEFEQHECCLLYTSDAADE